MIVVVLDVGTRDPEAEARLAALGFRCAVAWVKRHDLGDAAANNELFGPAAQFIVRDCTGYDPGVPPRASVVLAANPWSETGRQELAERGFARVEVWLRYGSLREIEVGEPAAAHEITDLANHVACLVAGDYCGLGPD
jgi:hypothetical protein